jgi:hypothetical protein
MYRHDELRQGLIPESRPNFGFFRPLGWQIPLTIVSDVQDKYNE